MVSTMDVLREGVAGMKGSLVCKDARNYFSHLLCSWVLMVECLGVGMDMDMGALSNRLVL